MRGSRVIVLALCAALASAPAVHADEEALRRRIQELEEQQKRFNEELQKLREELDRRPVAAPAAAPAPAPAAPSVQPAAAPSAVPAPVQPAAAPPAAAAPAESAKVEELDRKTGILTEELRKIREFLVLPETQELKGQYGLGPAASKVYGIERGLSIGGYGEANFKIVTKDADGADNEFDFVRLVAYLGYKFTDKIVFNSEIEFEHATTSSSVSSGSGSVSVEFATLDYLWHPAFNLRGGLVLVPMGFINEVHEPPFYLGNTRPPVETILIPSTWRSNGAGVFGQPFEGFEYKAYGITSFNAKGYQTLTLRNARQSGNRERADDWSFVGRVDYAPYSIWSAGGSLYLGDQGQNEDYGNEDIGFFQPGVFTQIYEVHTEVITQGVEFRLLGTTTLVDDAGILSQDDFIESRTGGQPIGKVLLGIYGEVAYNVLPLILPDTAQYLAPWFRYSWLDTNNKVAKGFSRDQAARRDFYEFGLQYKPIPQVVLKADYHIQDAESGTLPDELRLGGGFVF